MGSPLVVGMPATYKVEERAKAPKTGSVIFFPKMSCRPCVSGFLVARLRGSDNSEAGVLAPGTKCGGHSPHNLLCRNDRAPPSGPQPSTTQVTLPPPENNYAHSFLQSAINPQPSRSAALSMLPAINQLDGRGCALLAQSRNKR